MAIASKTFKYRIGEDGRYHQNGKLITIKEGEEIPEGIVPRLMRYNPEFIVEGTIKEEKPKKETVKKETKKKYTRKELYELRKEEQVKILKEYGLSNKEIKNLKYEKDRVKKILELQKNE